VVGLARAKELTLTGRRIDAQEAASIGLVNEVVAAGMAVARACIVAGEIALGAPIAVREAKRAIDAGFDLPIDQAMACERAAYAVVLGTEDRLEALRAFAEKRPPRFEGR
jgi:enoyl-CoA hydratase/carnithine racemase